MLLEIEIENWFWLAISILSVWRITTLICYEAGPFHVISKFRKILYRSKLGGLIDCFHCVAIWISIIFTILIFTISIKTIFLILAIAGGASIIERILILFPEQEK